MKDGSRTLTVPGGLPAIRLEHPSGAAAVVCLNGAHVTSWTLPDGEEMIFLSRRSRWEPGKAIRGGIPLVFPQFGPGPLPQHGFARTSQWTPGDVEEDAADGVRASFTLEDSDSTRSLWPHRFSARLTVTLRSGSLSLLLTVGNRNDSPFEFQTAFHTYFRVADISAVRLEGLKGVEYVDSLRGGVRESEEREAVTIDRETDRIYAGAPAELRLVDAGRGRTVTLRSEGLPDVVVWNPWVDKSRRMEDFGDDEYPSMLCVETGAILTPVSLGAGERWSGSTVFEAG